jgi:hypothetical protein
MLALVTNTPIWVWPLFIALVFVGIKSMKTREAPLALIYMLPLLTILTVNSVARLPLPSLAWSMFVLGYSFGVWLGMTMQPKWTLGHSARRVRLVGEKVTLLLMMLMFWLSFGNSVVRAVVPTAQNAWLYVGLLSLVLAIASGSFSGRCLSILRSRAGRLATVQ